jgi:hypothetical protein
LIQFWSVVMSEALAGFCTEAGGIGDVLLCIRATESCTSFFVGSSFEVARRSAEVTRPLSALLIGGSEWHAVHFEANTVATSQGTPAPGGTDPELEPDDDEDDEDEPEDEPEDAAPLEDVELEPPLDDPDPEVEPPLLPPLEVPLSGIDGEPPGVHVPRSL